jgi:amino acid adenylation domain-containing protein
VPLRCNLSGGPSFLDVLRRTRLMTLRAFSKAALPFVKIIEALSFRRDPSRNPIFQAMFELLPGRQWRIGAIQVTSFYFDPSIAQFDLSLHAREESHGYSCWFEYNTDVFERESIQRMAENFLQLLSSLVADPTSKITRAPILAEAQKIQLLLDWNRTSCDYPSQCLDELVTAAVTKSPSRVAIECGDRTVTYLEMENRANQLANHLIAAGVKKQELVGIYLERSPELVIALLGVLKSGGCYVPLDPLFPQERLAYMIDDARISIVLTQSTLVSSLPGGQHTLVCLDADRECIFKENTISPKIDRCVSDLAYTIYTSGSSGKPKGVMIEHRSVVNCLSSMKRRPGFDQSDVMVAVTTISFDIAVLEIFLPLISGGKLVIATKPETNDGSLLADLLQRRHATMLQATPVTWRLLLDAGWEAPRGMKMLCGGEALPPELATRLLRGQGRLWNMYGPTETTIWSAVYNVTAAAGPVPIGPPISNTQFYIVDNELQPVPIGVPGELLVGGIGLARGYLNRPNLTTERFIASDLGGAATRLYKTGDFVRYRLDGCIEFLGRSDFQVKVRGYRIELEEIEHVLSQHESIKDTAAVTWVDSNADISLVAYYIPIPGKSIPPEDLKKHIQRQLPGYMCPSFFVELHSFPVTPNGKINRKAFPPPDLSAATAESNYVAPRTEFEAHLAKIWQKVLKRRTIGLDDDFFDLGGHSLLAAKLFVAIEEEIGVKLSLATLFHCPTIRILSENIKSRVQFSNWTSLVPIQTHGEKPPLFLVHGAEGNVLLYRSLSQCLGQEQPVYGLQFLGLGGEGLLNKSIEAMAAEYIKEIRILQPTGPYYLGGYCLGGTIAFEIAQQLRRAGEVVELLAMIETYNVQSRPPISVSLNLVHKVENTFFQIGNLFLGDAKRQFFIEKLRTELSRLTVHCAIVAMTFLDRFRTTNSSKYRHLRVTDANHEAQARYTPVPYDGRIVLFRSRACFTNFDDYCFGWGPLAVRGVQIVELPSYPHGSLNYPFVGTLARELETMIPAPSESAVL